MICRGQIDPKESFNSYLISNSNSNELNTNTFSFKKIHQNFIHAYERGSA